MGRYGSRAVADEDGASFDVVEWFRAPDRSSFTGDVKSRCWVTLGCRLQAWRSDETDNIGAASGARTSRGNRRFMPARLLEAPSLRHRVLGSFHRASLDHLAGGLGLEHRRLLGEGVDALALLGGRFLDDDQANEAGNDEDTFFFSSA
jgi:hypothetical protein